MLPCLVHRYAYLCKSICVAMVLLWLVKLCRSGADSDSNKLFTVLLLAICVHCQSVIHEIILYFQGIQM